MPLTPAVSVADQYPNTQVIGNDLSPIQPSWIPPNVRFEVDDIELEWMHPENSTDLIHMRCLSGSISDWSTLLKNCYDNLTPGGYLEFVDYSCSIHCDDGSMPPDSAFKRFFELTNIASERAGRPLASAKEIKGLMQTLGFEDVVEKRYKWPIGAWAKDRKLKEIGRWSLPGMIDSLDAFAMGLLTRQLGWCQEQVGFGGL